MKNTLTLLLILFFGASCLAQGVFRNQTNNTLEKVVQDYPSQFKNISLLLQINRKYAGSLLFIRSMNLTWPGTVLKNCSTR